MRIPDTEMRQLLRNFYLSQLPHLEGHINELDAYDGLAYLRQVYIPPDMDARERIQALIDAHEGHWGSIWRRELGSDQYVRITELPDGDLRVSEYFDSTSAYEPVDVAELVLPEGIQMSACVSLSGERNPVQGMTYFDFELVFSLPGDMDSFLALGRELTTKLGNADYLVHARVSPSQVHVRWHVPIAESLIVQDPTPDHSTVNAEIPTTFPLLLDLCREITNLSITATRRVPRH